MNNHTLFLNNSKKTVKILISPLDWGLGHTTRCIPVIKYLLERNCEISVAGSPLSLVVLKNEFPDLNFYEITSYNIRYSANKRWMPLKIISQIPKILKAVSKEHNQLKKILEKYTFDAVISDNRFGFYSRKVYSIFITHQLQVYTGYSFFTNFIRTVNYKYIQQFNECWVPDVAEETNLAGILSHPKKKPTIKLHYLGALSRFKKNLQENFEYKYLVVISGPEPHRTLFQQGIFNIIKSSGEKFIVVLGKPEKKEMPGQLSNCKVYNHLSTLEMNVAFNKSEFFVGRCGYTSVMELLSVQKKSILIPTPGQTEQEYLAKHLMKQHWCYTFSAIDKLKEHLLKAENFNYRLPQLNADAYKNVIDRFLSTFNIPTRNY